VLEPMKREYEQVKAEESYNSFLAEHSDLKTDTGLRSEVQHLLETNASLDLETAYWAAKGKQARQAAAKAAETDKARRAAEREAAQRGTGLPRKGAAASPPAKGEVRSMSAADIYALAQSLHRR
jgi:septal ring factor EnvC (AmiA/AmiB activator)